MSCNHDFGRLGRLWLTFMLISATLARVSAAAAAAESDRAAPADGEFMVVAYNVEMLFDVDGVSLFDEYAPAVWGPTQLERKLAGISRVLQRMAETQGRPPDIICFNELEADQTPGPAIERARLAELFRDRTTREALSAPSLDPELATLPVEAWLAQRLAEDGLPRYHVAVGHWRQDPTGHMVFHTNAVFSRWPIVQARTHETSGARGILEVQFDVGGDHRLYVFNNHWKSGASDPATEPTRIGNAEVLRARLDEILRDDPFADVILTGDFNSQYNQKQRYPEMPRTAINDVLGSQGDEGAVATLRGPSLYNLWFELPHEQRRSDEYHEEWGTLMHILVTRGLYDARGLQYIDNSFSVGAFPGLNAEPKTGRPIRWTFADGGAGYSDHFPISARFRAGELEPMQLADPSRTADGPATPVPVALAFDDAIDLGAWPRDRQLGIAENLGKFFRVRGRVTSSRPLRVRVDGLDVEVNVWIHDRTQRETFATLHDVGESVSFIGELSQFRGEWQFVIPGSTLEK